jgi:BirA family biotin operon repressor/biotin-[acetyl-CoA-carboxylase] ligase
MCMALGTCDAIRTVTALDSNLKWPNDVMVNGKKCAGILAEAKITGDQVEYVIAGLGLNMNFAVARVPGIPPEATTIAYELGTYLAREPLVQAILTHSETYYERMRAGENLRPEWARRLATLHRQVRALTPWGEETGVAESVDDDGALIVRRADGSTIALTAGDVTLDSHL